METFFDTRRRVSRRNRRKNTPKEPPEFFWRVLRILFNAAIIIAALALICISAGYAYVIYTHDEALDRRYPDLIENSLVYDVDGRLMGEFRATENRRTVGPEGLGEHLPRAAVAIEDRRFYDHYGVDPAGVSRAAWADIRSWSVQEGGSTITEQLTKNLFISADRRGRISIWRRFEQAALSISYERRHTKEEILTAYLNSVYFGDGAYGAEMAAERYFSKKARDLTLPEAATLAGVLHAPSTYLTGDGEGIERATVRRNQVLERMADQGMISAAEFERAVSSPLVFAPDSSPDDPAYRPFMDGARREAARQLGPDAVERGGLKIYTTMEPATQRSAVNSIEQTLPYESDPSGAVASVEPQTGAIRAIAGGDGSFNLALDARRQPGSSFKPFVLAAALREYVSPQTVYMSRDLSFQFDGENVRIRNYDYIERGEITLRRAMAESDNTVYVQLAMDVGLGNVARMANDLGVTTTVDPYPSTAIGGLGVGVNALDMASAYATLAGGGVYRAPYSIQRIDRVGFGERENVFRHRVEGRRVLSSNQAAAATAVLRGVVQSGTASRFHNLDYEIGKPSAGKTGTTDDYVDAWYVGYTPRLSTAVWVGYPEGRTPMRNIHGLTTVNGENLPLDIWALYMAQATVNDPPINFAEPNWSEFAPLYRGNALGPASGGSGGGGGSSYSLADSLQSRIQSEVDQILDSVFGDDR